MKRLFLCLFLFSLGCSETRQFAGECKTAEECPTGSTCRIAKGDTSGLCVCRSDEACAEGEVCNTQGVCQKRAGCRSNVECEASKFCDLATGACIDRTACGSDVHCLPGTVCDDTGTTCVNGCFDNADCPLYSVCMGGGPGVRGSCLAGRCTDPTFCDYGDFCAINGNCTDATNPSFCAACSQANPCPANTDFCLINSGYDPGRPENGGPNFCGVSCTSPDECPAGYQCGGVVLLTQDQCTNSNECGGGGRECVLGEGDLRGFCTCVNDQDCAADTVPPACNGSCGGLGIQPCDNDNQCLTTCQKRCQFPAGQACTTDDECQPLPICGAHAGPGSMVCANNLQPCSTGADCLCNAGTCLNSGRPCTTGAQCNPPCQGGGCVLGSACAPVQGLYCPDVL